MNKSCLTYEWVMSNIWMSHVAHMNESCHTYEWVISKGSTIVTAQPTLIFTNMYSRTSYVWHDSFIFVTWLIHMCGMTHSYVWHDSFICVTWLIHTGDMTHSYVWHDSSHSHTQEHVLKNIFSRTCTYAVATIGRLLKILGLFCKRAHKRDDILQKRPMIFRSLLIVATP